MDLGSNKEEWTNSGPCSRIRRLFEDTPALSDIPEEDESLVQYYLRSHNSNSLETACNAVRPSSPLPDLTIEVVPRRPRILYDESEEFYAALEKEMKRRYRRDYLHIYSDNTSDEEIESLSNVENIEKAADSNEISNTENSTRSQTIIKPSIGNSVPCNNTKLLQECNRKSGTRNETDSAETTHEDKTEKMDNESDNENYEEESEIEEEEMNNKRVTKTSDETSQDGEEEEIDCEKDSEMSEEEFDAEEEDLEINNEGDMKICEEESEAEEDEETEKVAENSGDLDDTSVSEPGATMRGPNTRDTTLSSVPSRQTSSEQEFDPIEGRNNLSMVKELEVDNTATSNNEMHAHDTPDLTMLHHSTPKSAHKSLEFRTTGSSNRFQPYSSRNRRNQVCEKAVQTSFSDDTESDDAESWWRNFFVGKPKFYKVVPCS